jgi:Flp pilus assembly pilin Flp
MSNAIALVRRFLVSKDGPTAVESAVMLSLILVVCISVVTMRGQATSDKSITLNIAISGS